MVEKTMEKEVIKEVILSNDPHIHTRAILFDEDKTEQKNKNQKQFITCKEAMLTVLFKDEEKTLNIVAPKGYIFDGATIPFGIGKGNMKLLIPALFHDIMCDNKMIIGFDRKLASMIFKACLLSCGVNKCIAHIMYVAVEAYQKFFCDWSKE